MRRAALAPLLALPLLACTTASGAETELCDAGWRQAGAEILAPGGADERTVPIDCMRPIERRRLRIGFTMPAGPECFRLSRIDVVETADAVSVTLYVARDDRPDTGACPEVSERVRTELDLQQAAGSRDLLDGSR